MYTYENLRYALLHYWHFCNELGPPTTWREAWRELRSGPSAAAYWYSTLPAAEKRRVLKTLTSDMKAALANPKVKYCCPRGHARVTKTLAHVARATRRMKSV